MRYPRLTLAAAFAAVYVIWGSTYLAIRFSIETIPPFLMGGTRFLIAGAVMYGFVRMRGAPKPAGRHWVAASIVGGLLLLGGNGSVVWAEQRVPSGLAALLVATEPLWVVMIDWARPRGVRPRVGEVLGLILGFGGAALLVSPAELVGGVLDVDPIGAAVILFAAVSWALGSVYSRHADTPASPLLTTGMNMLAGGLLLLVFGVFAGDLGRLNVNAVSLKSFLAFIYLIVFGSLVAFTAYIWLLKNTTLARASTYAYVNPVVAVFLGWGLADEPLTARVILAAGIIVTSVVFITGTRVRDVTQQTDRRHPSRAADRLTDAESTGGPTPTSAAEAESPVTPAKPS